MTKLANSAELLTPEQVADRLGLHVKTVRRYIRDGQLESVPLGKRYRVTQAGLDSFMGLSVDEAAAATSAEASSVVSIDSLSQNAADDLTKNLLASVQGREPTDRSLRLDTVYNFDQQRLKVIVTGSLSSTTILLSMINTLIG